MKLKDFKLIDYFNQPPEIHEEYSIVLRYLNPRKTKRQIIRMKLKHVNFIRDAMTLESGKDLIKVVSIVQEMPEKKVLDLGIIEFFGLMASIRQQLSIIAAAEEKLTPSYTDAKWQAVNGSERMAKFGIYNTLESLSGGDVLKYEGCMNMEYAEVFTILLMRKTQADLQYEMNQIKSKS